MKTNNDNPKELQIIKYWYDESDNLTVLQSFINHMHLKLSNSDKAMGLVLNQDDSLYINGDHSFSVGLDLAIGNSEYAASKLDKLAGDINNIIAWNTQQLKNQNLKDIVKQHKILLPMNLSSLHWVALEIIMSFVQQDNNFTIAKEIVTNVYDSSNIFQKSYMDKVHNMLSSIMNDAQNSFIYKGQLFYTKRQPDDNSCGPLTCNTILDIIAGKDIALDNESYTFDDIKQLRLQQIEIVNSPSFVDKQLKNVVSNLSYKVLNRDSASLAKAMCDYIDNPLSDIFVKMQELVDADRLMQTTTYSDEVVTHEKFEKNEKNYREKLQNVKDWFNANYDKLKELNILQSFFKTPENKLAVDELEWIDNGKDTLIEVLKKLSIKLNVNDAVDNEDLKNTQTKTVFSNPIKVLTIIKTSFLNNMVFCDYKGDIRFNSNNSSEIYCEEWAENIEGTYSFTGEIYNGVKTGVCDEQFIHDTLKQATTFVGRRDKDGQFLDGFIKCFIGNQMENGTYLQYEGGIEHGKLNGNAKLYMVDKDHFYAEISCTFKDDVLISDLEIKKEGIHSTDSKITAKLQDAIDSDLIQIHLFMYASEKNVIFKDAEEKLTNMRNKILSKYKPEPSKALKKYFFEEDDHVADNIEHRGFFPLRDLYIQQDIEPYEEAEVTTLCLSKNKNLLK